jgi:hypothetical protein
MADPSPPLAYRRGGDTADNRGLLHASSHHQVHNEGMVVEKAASSEGRS